MPADWSAIAQRIARRKGIDPQIFDAQMSHESMGYNPDVISGRTNSPAGAQGIAQIMPDTARGWNVDPLKPRKALRAAADNMRNYVEEYGGYENALRAYNAGPSAIEASRGYSETNNYVDTIMNGRNPGPLQAPQSGRPRVPNAGNPGNSPASPVPKLVSIFARMNEAQNANPFIPQSQYEHIGPTQDDYNNTWSLMDQVFQQQNPAPTPRPTNVPGGTITGGNAGNVKGRPNARGNPGEILEMFYNGPGGVNVDEGKLVPQGFVPGHETHVHVAADEQTIRAIARLAQDMDIDVRELEGFDPVDPVHTGGSFHYSKQALDANGTPAQLLAFNKEVAKRFGLSKRR